MVVSSAVLTPVVVSLKLSVTVLLLPATPAVTAVKMICVPNPDTAHTAVNAPSAIRPFLIAVVMSVGVSVGSMVMLTDSVTPTLTETSTDV